MKNIATILIILSFSLTGCFYGLSPHVEITKISDVKFQPKQDSVEIYWEDGNVHPQQYQQVAFIEVQGNAYSNPSELLPLLALEAKKLGADALINVKKTYITRASGELITEILNNKNSSNEYIASTVSGVAIRYLQEAQVKK